MATFSVIVPVYNAEQTIRRCVESIVKSGGDDVEVILIEDCSRDGSWEVCQQLAAEYGNVICLRNEKNRGVSHTRNRGLEQADGEYLLFVDSDDWVDAEYIPTFRRAVKEGAEFAICGYVNHDEKQRGRVDVYTFGDQSEYLTVELKPSLLKLYDQCLLQQLWNKLFRAAPIREKGIRFDERISIGEDTRFILEYLKQTGIQTVMQINRPLYHYMRDQAGSLMFRVGYESVEEPLKNLRSLYELIGMSEETIQSELEKERRRQIELYAYLIMHNMGMKLKEKKRLILSLDEQAGCALYRKNRLIYYKEIITRFIKGS